MTDDKRLENLLSIYNYILIQTNGDVEEALEWMKMLSDENNLFDDNLTFSDFVDELKKKGYIAEKEGLMQLTPKGSQRIRLDAMNNIFSGLKPDTTGFHETNKTGSGVEKMAELKKYKFGDQITNIDLTSTIKNAFLKTDLNNFRLEEDDIEVFETEAQTTVATVLMIDISHSMILYGEDRITPAKK
jgi:Ca-activated chloride channel family protein